MMDHTYKGVELVGSSPEGVQQAIDSAITRAGQSLQHLDWFEIKETRGSMQEGKVAWYQGKVGVGYRVLDPVDLERD